MDLEKKKIELEQRLKKRTLEQVRVERSIERIIGQLKEIDLVIASPELAETSNFKRNFSSKKTDEKKEVDQKENEDLVPQKSTEKSSRKSIVDSVGSYLFEDDEEAV